MERCAQKALWMKIILNGESREVEDAIGLGRLLESLELRPEHVAVEVNRELIPRAQHAAHTLCEGDQLEVVTLVGGG